MMGHVSQGGAALTLGYSMQPLRGIPGAVLPFLMPRDACVVAWADPL